MVVEFLVWQIWYLLTKAGTIENLAKKQRQGSTKAPTFYVLAFFQTFHAHDESHFVTQNENQKDFEIFRLTVIEQAIHTH